MKYTSALIAVRSMAVSLPFYEKVLDQKVVLNHGKNVAFESGLALQEGFADLVGFPAEQTRWKTYNMELYFEVDDMEPAVERLKAAGVELLHDVKEYPWGQHVLRFFDPDGHIIELGESMKAVVLHYLDQGLSDEEVSKRTMHPMEFIQWCKTQR